MYKKTFTDWVFDIQKELIEISNEMCNHYCKYKEEYKQNEDWSDDNGKIPCVNCPMIRIIR